MNYYPSWSRHNVTEKTERSLHPGTMTREEVLLLLGEPDRAWEDGQRLGYAWAKVRAIIAVAGAYGQGVRADVGQVYLLQVWFDASDRIFQVSTVKAEAPPWAVFTTLTVTVAGTGSGIVTSTPVGITCRPACSADYAIGTAITLTSTPTEAGSM